MIARARKSNDRHDVIFFAPIVVVVTVADKGGTHPQGCPPKWTPSSRRRGRDPLLLKPQNDNDDKDNDALIASTSIKDEDHVRLSSGLQRTVESPA